MPDLSTIDAPIELRESVAACVQWSQSNQIVTADDYAVTSDHLKQIKSQQKAADEFFDGPIAQAHQLHKMLVARKKVITDPLTQSEQIDKRKMIAFQQAEAAKAEAERRRLQAIADEQARIEREKAEAIAAEQRRIEAKARADAEAARQLALEADEQERQRLLAEAEAEEQKASAAAAEAQSSAEQAVTTIAPVVHVAAVTPKIAGLNVRKIWKAQIVNLDQLLTFICQNNRHDLILVNEKMLDAYAKSMKAGAKMPGVRFVEEAQMASRGAA